MERLKSFLIRMLKLKHCIIRRTPYITVLSLQYSNIESIKYIVLSAFNYYYYHSMNITSEVACSDYVCLCVLYAHNAQAGKRRKREHAFLFSFLRCLLGPSSNDPSCSRFWCLDYLLTFCRYQNAARKIDECSWGLSVWQYLWMWA